MQNLHKTTLDRPLTGVYWPIQKGRCRGSRTKGDLGTSTGGTPRGAGWRTRAIILVSARDLDRIIDRTICSSSRAQATKGYGPLECNSITATCRQGIEKGLNAREACTCVCRDKGEFVVVFHCKAICIINKQDLAISGCLHP